MSDPYPICHYSVNVDLEIVTLNGPLAKVITAHKLCLTMESVTGKISEGRGF